MRERTNYKELPYNPALRQRTKELRKTGNIVDFYGVNCRVVVEIDGASHDGKGEYDQERGRFLERLGLTVIHIPASDVLNRLDDVILMLYDHPAFSGDQ